METVVSGIRPTGELHLGNYFGAIKNFVKMQEDYRCFFFIADYHSLTTHPTPNNLHYNVKRVLINYLASGLDPEKSTIYIQSDLPEVAELYLLLNMNAYLGELQRVTSFKEKARKQPITSTLAYSLTPCSWPLISLFIKHIRSLWEKIKNNIWK
jgi:tryptophanyl-tRNA synthetase